MFPGTVYFAFCFGCVVDMKPVSGQGKITCMYNAVLSITENSGNSATLQRYSAIYPLFDKQLCTK